MKRQRSTRQTPAAKPAAQMGAQLASLQAELTRALKASIHNEVRAAVAHVEAQASLLARINGLLPLPAMTAWPVSPDMGLTLADMLDTHTYHAVVELGSGVSTYVVAALLARPDALPHVRCHVALEHLPKYQEQTQALLARLGQAQRTSVTLCPLVPWTAPDGTPYSYYDCAAPLAAVAATLPTDGTARVLVLVDGPPGGTGRWSRYPALPWLLQTLPQAELHVLLDDHKREEEQALAQAWQSLLTEQAYTFTTETLPLEKGGLWLNISRKT